EKLKKQIADFSAKVCICGEAGSGDEAIAKLAELQPDILITDIRMPGKSGLEAAKYATSRHPGISCIIISGYRDFEFAREALQLGSVDYLLKPVESEQLYASIEKAILRVHHTRLQASILSVLSLEPSFQRIVDGEAAEAGGFASKLLEAFPEFRGDQGKVVLMLDDEMPREPLQQWLWDETEGLVFRLNQRAYAMIAVLPDSTEVTGVEPWLRRVAEEVRRQFQSCCAIAASAVFYRGEELAAHASQAFDRYALRYYEGDRWLAISSGALEAGPPEAAAEWVQPLADQIVQAVSGVQQEETDRLVAKLFSRCVDERILFTQVQATAARMLRHIANRFDGDQLQRMGLEALVPMQWVQRSRSISGLADDLRGLFARIFDFQRQFHGSVHAVVGRVQYIVQNEYHRSDLSITEIAERLHFNQSYLSHQFKKRTGDFFYQYLTRWRMDKAKELLREPRLKTYEVAYSVGYKNEKAFSRAFKKMCAASPQEYRKEIGIW
ncbi:MAG: two-component system response regulator, partial [Paenibacillaceae bacterium]|nr:two-component system response regulator [Paenibacillaceae bacterium]